MPDPEEWSELGGSTPPTYERDSNASFFCSLWYDAELGRLEYSAEAGKNSVSGEDCEICLLKKEKKKKCLFLTTKCAPFRRWVVRIVKVGECYECQKHA